MIKAVKVVTLSLAALFLSVNVASASTFGIAKGMNPCLFGLKNLKNHGYNDKASYTSEEIQQLLKRSDIEAKNLNTLAPGQTYQVTYSCHVDHHLARINLQALPTTTGGLATTIYWEATKPA